MRDRDPIASGGQSPRKHFPALAGLVLLLAAWSLAGSAVEAQASHVACGAVITVDTVLDSDLRNCPGNGVVIGADDVDLDLNGHTIRGDNAGGYDVDNGVYVEGRARVTIVNGGIEGFFAGILARDSQLTVDRMQVRCGSASCFNPNATEGIRGEGATAVSISRSRISSMQVGIYLVPAGGRIEGNVITGNGVGVALEGGGGPGTIVRDNVFTGTTAVAIFDSEPLAPGNVVEENLITNGSSGVSIHASTGNRVSQNRLRNVSRGIRVAGESSNATVSGNRIVGGREAVEISQSFGSVVRENVVMGSDLGIEVFASSDTGVMRNRLHRIAAVGISVRGDVSFGSTFRTELSRNRVTGAGEDGIFVDARSFDSMITRNTADRNGDDGIDVDSAATTLTGNTANRNGDLGIDAVPGVTDGGGNSARRNGNPEQCTGVTCR